MFMSYLKSLMTLAVLAGGCILPLQAHASPQGKKVSYNTSHSHKRAKKPAHSSEASFAARQRMHNRALLLSKQKEKQRHEMPLVEGSTHDKAALRSQNRRYLEQHPEWFATPYRRHNLHLQDGTSLADSQHLQTVTDEIVNRLQHQLGKPYVWGGESPEEGFDCSGLVYFAYNKLLAAKLPRTADEMYHFRRAKTVADNDLQRGDLLFFHIHTRNKADHVGVYLGDGRFIESPRTGERIRISYLADAFWQEHYLGSKRILTDNTVL